MRIVVGRSASASWSMALVNAVAVGWLSARVVHCQDGDEEGMMGSGMDGLQTMGIVNALKTGDVATDMIIAMSIPLLLRLLFGFIGRMNFGGLDAILKLFRRPTKMYTRQIEHHMMRDRWGGSNSLDEDTQNQVLIKAVQLYLDHLGTLKLDHASMRLTSLQDNLGINRHRYYQDDDDDDEEGGSKKSLAGSLAKYKIVRKPPEHEWHKVGKYRVDGKTASEAEKELQIAAETKGAKDSKDAAANPKPAVLSEVELMISIEEKEESKDSGSQRIDITLDLQSEGEKCIDAFVATAYEWFVGELRKMDDSSRYLYEMCMEGGGSDDYGGGGSDGGFTYKRYKLSDEKTFDSLFFEEKESLLALIRHFTNKTGKYSIRGYPHKLGLLLHGPPGTGKTSLIKALAQHTGRSIVNVPLARISTNSELMSVFFDKTYQVQGDNSGVPIKMGFKDVIFVMEDVDAASRVVRRRDGKRTAYVSQKEQVDITLPPPKSTWRILLESQDCSCRELVDLLMEKSQRLKEEALKTDTVQALAQRMAILPGLSLVGSEAAAGQDAEPAVQKLASESLERAQTVLDGYDTLDRFTSAHASALKALLDAGAEVDEQLEDQLLGVGTTTAMEGDEDMDSDNDDNVRQRMKLLPKLNLSRDVSYNKYMDDSDKVEVEEQSKEAILSALVGTLTESGGGEKGEGHKTKDSGTSTNDAGGGGGGGEKKTMGPTMEGFGGGGGVGSSSWSKPKKDELNLTGLLNVLDGVVDTPGRILVMTTNHPEMLDPALIRPGRIDKKMILSYMRAQDVVQMLEHYFQLNGHDDNGEVGGMDSVLVERVERAILGDDSVGRPALNMTPAQIEQLAAEHDEIEDMVAALELKGQPLAAGSAGIVPAKPYSKKTKGTTATTNNNTSSGNDSGETKRRGEFGNMSGGAMGKSSSQITYDA